MLSASSFAEEDVDNRRIVSVIAEKPGNKYQVEFENKQKAVVDENVLIVKNKLHPALTAYLEKNGIYIVRFIVAERKFSNKLKYKIRWKGYTVKHDTWEFADGIPKEKIDEFNEKKKKKIIK